MILRTVIQVLATGIVFMVIFWGFSLLGLYLVQDYERREFEDMANDYDKEHQE